MNKPAEVLDDDVVDIQDSIEKLHAHIEELHDLLQQKQEQISGLHNDVASIRHELRRVPGGEESNYWQNLDQSNRELRESVAALARTLGLKPVKISGNRWVPDLDRRESPLAGEPGHDVIDALRLTVHAELRDMFNDETLGRDKIRRYLQQVLDQNLQQIVKDTLGIDTGSYRTGLRDGEMKKRLHERIGPLIDECLDAHMGAIRNAVELPEIEDNLRTTAQDIFRNRLRDHLLTSMKDRAEELASKVLKDTVDTVILEEMPWLGEALRRHRTMEKLGHTERGAPHLDLTDDDE